MVSPKLLALHSWHQMAGLRVKRKSPQKSQPAQHRVHLASGAAVLSWPHHKDGRHMHAQSSLLQQTPRRKAWLWCSKKALQRQMKRQLAQAEISHQSWQQQASDQDNWCSSMRKASHKFEAEKEEATAMVKCRRQKKQHNPYHPQPKPSSVQSTVGCAHQELDSTATSEHVRTDHQPSQKSPPARNQPSGNAQEPVCRRHLGACINSGIIGNTQDPARMWYWVACINSGIVGNNQEPVSYR